MSNPRHSGTCNKCDDEYEVWNFDQYGNSTYCSSCHRDLRSLDRTGCPSFTKPLEDQEKIIMDALVDELGLKVWEAEWRCYLYWP
jgi:hypothetical protein